jgi:hypothetical protein
MSYAGKTSMSADRLMAERIARNEATFREANEQINVAAAAFDVAMRVPFICECADRACREVVRLRLQDYEAVRSNPRYFLNVPGHQAAAQGLAKVVSGGDGYLIAEKQGHAGEVAEALDERRGEEEREVESGQ